MLNKMKNWMDKPITNGSVMKMTLISTAIGVAEIGLIFVGPWVVEKFDEFKEFKEHKRSEKENL